ncbi:MAG: hypothetical protein H7177_10565 [Rhizobacter sp.]|nr:hypothetical protein [Bacteriovorax sp.]
MLKKVSLVFTLSLITAGQAMACPNCMGSNPNDKYYLYVVGAFVLTIYFPMYYFYKTFKKFKNINNNDLPQA